MDQFVPPPTKSKRNPGLVDLAPSGRGQSIFHYGLKPWERDSELTIRSGDAGPWNHEVILFISTCDLPSKPPRNPQTTDNRRQTVRTVTVLQSVGVQSQLVCVLLLTSSKISRYVYTWNWAKTNNRGRQLHVTSTCKQQQQR